MIEQSSSDLKMELGLSNTLLAGDPRLIDHIVGEVKSQGIFDQFRKECIADVDTKPAYQNLRTRVEGSVNSFLSKQAWKPDLNKNQLRETLRKHIHDAPYLDAGVERIVDQVVNPKVYSVFMPQIEDVVYKFLGLERPKTKERNGACGLKDLLPKDLDPVSPESDKNSLKDVSLESIDENDDLDSRKDDRLCIEQTQQAEDCNSDNKDMSIENGGMCQDEKLSDEILKSLNKSNSSLNLNTSTKSDDKTEEDEEDSPTFEPIDIMNLNESNISNDSHLSGISELTSHRSGSPDFSNELSRDNFEYSNQDSQLSKVSSDSRLSIVTDFGSSNHALTPIHDVLKEDSSKDKAETKNVKDNFKAVREFETYKNKSVKNVFDLNKNKDTAQDIKDKESKSNRNSISSKENSRDATDSSVKDKYEHKTYKEKNKDSDSSKSKVGKEKVHSKDTKHYKDKDTDKKKQGNHSDTKYDKHSKHKSKERSELSRDGSEKPKDFAEMAKDNINKSKEDKIKEADKKDNTSREVKDLKDLYSKHKSKEKSELPRDIYEKPKDFPEVAKDSVNKTKEDKIKEIEKKDSTSKEVKDLKDLYKEKIRELREKKELTEKEKLNKDNKEVKPNKESKDKKDSTKDKKSYKKEHRSSSSSSSKTSSSSHHDGKSNKTSDRPVDTKDRKSESKDKTKRDEKHVAKDSPKDSKTKGNSLTRSDSMDKSERQDVKKIPKDEKGEKSEIKKDIKFSNEKVLSKKDAKNNILNIKGSEKSGKPDSKKDGKTDVQSKEKKRREEKKSKQKDDHSSLRKNSNDRRSTDRDGSNGSNGKGSQSNNSSSTTTGGKSSASGLNKESNHVNNSSGETSDSVEEASASELKSLPSYKASNVEIVGDEATLKFEQSADASAKEAELGSTEASLPLKKRPLLNEDGSSATGEVKIKKPKFAKNFHEAKKLMKIRKQLEKQKLQQYKKVEKVVSPQPKLEVVQPSTTNDANDLDKVPDEERVQIIEIPDEEYEEPYPEQQTNLTLGEQSIIMLEGEACTNELLQKQLSLKSKLSSVDISIAETISETITETITERLAERIIEKQLEAAPEATKDTEEAECWAGPSQEEVISKKVQCSDTVVETVRRDDKDLQLKEEETEARTDEPEEMPESSVMEESPESTQITRNELPAIDDEKNVKQDLTKLDEAIPETSQQSKSANDSEEGNDFIPPIETSKRAGRLSLNKDCVDIEPTSASGEDHEDCRYFSADKEKSEKFSNFLETLELVESSTLEDIIESLGGQVVSSKPMAMAPPLPKRKHSSSPLTDILLNNSNNNNDGHKLQQQQQQQQLVTPSQENTLNNIKKRKLIGPKKQRFQASVCPSQSLLNGENFVMPLSPESDVSATSEKTPSVSAIKEEKSRHRSSQRYSSDDLYKPRPLFSSSSRRSRRSNQA